MKTRPRRTFIKERRRNACPACLDREALTMTGHVVYEPRLEELNLGKCGVCDGRGYVVEVYPVGNEWRRYPWVIVG